MHICLFVLNLRQLESSKRNEKTKQKTKHKKTHTQNTQNQNVVVVWVYIYMFKCQNNNTIQTKQCLLRIVYICRQFDIHTRQTTHLICVCALHVCSSCALFASFFSFFFLFFTKKRNEKREKNLFFWGWNGNGNGFGGRRNAIRKKRRKDYIVFLSFFSNYKSREQRLNLSRSQQQGHSATYNTPFLYLSRMQRIYLLKQFKLWLNSTEMPLVLEHSRDLSYGLWWKKNKHLWVRISSSRRRKISSLSSMDSGLEAFSHNPADGSIAPLAVQPGVYTKCLN